MTYEFKCEDCGEEFENQFKMSDEHICDCPICGSKNTKKIVSLCSFSLKNGGWYKDGYSSTINKMKGRQKTPDDV